MSWIYGIWLMWIIIPSGKAGRRGKMGREVALMVGRNSNSVVKLPSTSSSTHVRHSILQACMALHILKLMWFIFHARVYASAVGDCHWVDARAWMSRGGGISKDSIILTGVGCFVSHDSVSFCQCRGRISRCCLGLRPAWYVMWMSKPDLNMPIWRCRLSWIQARGPAPAPAPASTWSGIQASIALGEACGPVWRGVAS